MRCPFCQNPTTCVVDSRAPDTGAIIRRRRQCPVHADFFPRIHRIPYARRIQQADGHAP